MKCKNCGFDFDEGIFCPECGTKHEMDNAGNAKKTEKVNKENSTEQEENVSVTEAILDGVKSYRNLRLKLIFLGAYVVAFFAFIEQRVLTCIAFIIVGILLMPPLLKKIKGKKKIIPIIIAVILAVIGIIGWYSDDGNSSIDYIKQYQDPDALYSIGEFMEMTGVNVTWDLERMNDIEYVTASIDSGYDVIDVVFELAPNSNPELYDVLLNGTKSTELFDEFDSRLFGNGNAGQVVFESAENEQSDISNEAEYIFQNETENNVEDDSLNNGSESVDALEYFILNSSREYFSMEYFEGFTEEMCRLARNGIYARLGRGFNDESLVEYFEQYDWYDPIIAADDFDESMLNECAKANAQLIVEYEKSQGYK